MTSIIKVSELSKDYMLYNSPRQRLWSLLWPNSKAGKRFTALQPLSFDLPEGQTLGVIGRNGSGKSTLLQMLAGTLSPTQGAVEVAGTIAALLELGAGFNPDFTGRENVYLNGSILGFSREEMASRIGEILEFANIGEFVDRPLSTYSSGMVVRLAFAVATAVQPKLLIIDEALSVGDEAFQRKCFRRIEGMRESGTSILFVSHSTQAVVQLCNRVIWLDGGKQIMDGEPKTVTEEYHRYLQAKPKQRAAILKQIAGGKPLIDVAMKESSTGHDYPPTGGEISNLQITTPRGKAVTTLSQGEKYQISYEMAFDEVCNDIRAGMMIKNRTGVEISAATLSLANQGIKQAEPGDKVKIAFDFTCHLNPATYFLNCGVRASVDGEDKYLHRKVDALALNVLTPQSLKGMKVGGLTTLDYKGKVKKQ